MTAHEAGRPDNHRDVLVDSAAASGHIVALLSDGIVGRTTLAIFDALALAAGPVATIPLPLLPIAFHGDWDGAGAAAEQVASTCRRRPCGAAG